MAGKRHAAGNRITQDVRRLLRLLQSFGRHLGEQRFQFHLAAIFVFDAREELPHNAEGGRHNAAGHARMHAFGQHPHRQFADQIAAQGRGQPKLIVIAATRVETHHQIGRADALRQMLDIGGQIGRTGFL